MNASIKYYEPIGVAKSITDGCNSFSAFYERKTFLYEGMSLEQRIKSIAILILLYLPAKITCFSEKVVCRFSSTQIPPMEYERKRQEYLKLFDFGELDAEKNLEILISKRLPSLRYKKIYVIQIHEGRSNRSFANDANGVYSYEQFLVLRENNEKVLFCLLDKTNSYTLQEYWTGNLTKAGGNYDLQTHKWMSQKCDNVIDTRSIESLYEKLRTLEDHIEKLPMKVE